MSSATVCHSLDIIEIITAYSFGITRPSPSKDDTFPYAKTGRCKYSKNSDDTGQSVNSGHIEKFGSRNRIDGAYQHIESDTNDQPVADKQQYNFDHLPIGDRNRKIFFLNKPLKDLQEKVDDLRVDADKKQDHQTDRQPFVIIEQVVRKKEQRNQNKNAAPRSVQIFSRKKADRHFPDRCSSFFVCRHAGKQR